MDVDTITGFFIIVIIVLGAYYIGYFRGREHGIAMIKEGTKNVDQTRG